MPAELEVVVDLGQDGYPPVHNHRYKSTCLRVLVQKYLLAGTKVLACWYNCLLVQKHLLAGTKVLAYLTSEPPIYSQWLSREKGVDRHKFVAYLAASRTVRLGAFSSTLVPLI